jgi:hypothetical protein
VRIYPAGRKEFSAGGKKKIASQAFPPEEGKNNDPDFENH